MNRTENSACWYSDVSAALYIEAIRLFIWSQPQPAVEA
jgi:hypothetical protein